jgi:hypothetical protein
MSVACWPHLARRASSRTFAMRKALILIASQLLFFVMSNAAEPVQKAIVLQNKDGKHMGFMLTHLRPTEKEGDYQGECVFTLLPTNSDLIETDLGILISELKVAGEHSCHMTVGTNRTDLVVTPKKLPELTLVIASNGKGSLSKKERGVVSQIGLVEFTKK